MGLLERAISEAKRLDGAIAAVSPGWAAARADARLRFERASFTASKVRGFNATSKSRRIGDGFRALGTNEPTESPSDLAILRERSRELRRNNPYWNRAVQGIVGHTVGRGIRAEATHPKNKRLAAAVQRRFDDWAKSKRADAAGRLDWYGIQSLSTGGMVEGGETLVRRRHAPDGSLKLQMFGAEYLSSSVDGRRGENTIIGGVEVDTFGAPVAYHMHTEHPSSGRGGLVKVPAKDIVHMYRLDRSGQVRGIPWIAPVFTRLTDWDDYEDAELTRQKMAACFGVVYRGMGGVDDLEAEIPDKVEPGMIEFLPEGGDVSLISPPAAQGLAISAQITHRAIAAGLGISYELLTGDYSRVNFSSARMSHLQLARNVGEWRDHIVIEHLCDRVWQWFLEAESVRVDGLGSRALETGVVWTAPTTEMIDPEKENRADRDRVRNGFASWSDVARERGRDPQQLAERIAADAKRFDQLELVLDCDPRHVSAQGQGAVNQKEEPTDGDETNQAA